MKHFIIYLWFLIKNRGKGDFVLYFIPYLCTARKLIKISVHPEELK